MGRTPVASSASASPVVDPRTLTIFFGSASRTRRAHTRSALPRANKLGSPPPLHHPPPPTPDSDSQTGRRGAGLCLFWSRALGSERALALSLEAPPAPDRILSSISSIQPATITTSTTAKRRRRQHDGPRRVPPCDKPLRHHPPVAVWCLWRRLPIDSFPRPEKEIPTFPLGRLGAESVSTACRLSTVHCPQPHQHQLRQPSFFFSAVSREPAIELLASLTTPPPPLPSAPVQSSATQSQQEKRGRLLPVPRTDTQ